MDKNIPSTSTPKKPRISKPLIDLSASMRKTPTAESSNLADLIENSRLTQKPIGHIREGEDGPELVGVQGKPGSFGILDLSDLVPALSDAGDVKRTPFARLSARHDRLTMSDLIERSSRCIQAGVSLGLLAAPPALDAAGRGPVLKREIDKFRVMRAASFEIIPDPEGTDLTPQALPYDEFQFDREDDLIPIGAAIRIPRANLRDLGADEIAAEIIWAIGAGIGKAVDRLLLDALDVALLPAFTLAAAAARGVFWDDLRGMIGVGAVATTENGELRQHGVSSELCEAAAEVGVDAIGAFARAALFINPTLEAPSFSDRDWIAKIAAACNFGVFDVDPELKHQIWAEARGLLDRPSPDSSQDQMTMPQLWARYQVLTEVMEEHEGSEDCQIHRAVSGIRDQVEEKALARPCAALGDFAIKMLMTHAGGAGITDDPIWKEARVLALGLDIAPVSAPAREIAESSNTTDTAIMRLFRLHSSIRAAASEYFSATRPAEGAPELDDRLSQLSDAIETEIMALPSIGAADMAAKMIVHHSGGEQSCKSADAAVWVEARKLTGLVA